jgi:hypothetical protein
MSDYRLIGNTAKIMLCWPIPLNKVPERVRQVVFVPQSLAALQVSLWRIAAQD